MTGPDSARDPRRHRLLTLVLALAALGSWNCGPPTPGVRGVVLITIDTLRSDHLGAYGGDRVATPNIDRLSAEGTLFERAFTPMPSHASGPCFDLHVALRETLEALGYFEPKDQSEPREGE